MDRDITRAIARRALAIAWLREGGGGGPQGPQGVPGAQGPQGNAGAQGPQGNAGAQGPQGNAGAQGPQGNAGAQGPQGTAGAQGPQGNAGAQGPQGTQGPQGPQGVNGGFGIPVLNAAGSAVAPAQASVNNQVFQTPGALSTLTFPNANNGDLMIVKLVGASVDNGVELIMTNGFNIEVVGNPGNFTAGPITLLGQGQSVIFQALNSGGTKQWQAVASFAS